MQTQDLKNTTTYIGGMVYESKSYSTVPATLANYTHQLQFAAHEEGRIRAVRNNPQDPITSFAYDYMLKDHLGNVRMLLTDEVKSDAYTTLSFEGASGSTEVNNQNAVWENASGQSINVISRRITSPVVLTNSGLPPPPLGNSLLVRSSTGKVGAGKLVKVMAGDKINTSVQYYYPTTSGSGTGSGINTLVTGLASVLANSIGSGALLKGAGTSLANGVTADPQAVNFFNNQNNTPAAGKPKAYLNVLFFDEQFKLDSAASKYQQVGTGSMTPGNPGQIGFMAGSALLAQKSGYCYIYISNESDELVYFDNLTLTHDRSSLMEETHYYPFGLVMAGISSKASGRLENEEKTFQGQRFDDDLGLNWVQFKWRNHDPQIGRFIEIDPLSEKYFQNSTYAFSENHVTSHVELEGLEKVSIKEAAAIQTAKDGYGDYYKRNYSLTLTGSKMTSEQIFNDIGNNFSKYTTGQSYFEKVKGTEGTLAVGDEFSVTGGPNYQTTPVSEIKKNFPNSGDQLLEAQKDFVDEASGTFHWGDIHTGVTVSGISKSDGASSFTFSTWEGHVEAGQINFSMVTNKDGTISFSITSNSRSSNFFTDKAYRYLGGYESQTKHWTTFLSNLVKRTGSNQTTINMTTTNSEDPIE